MWKLLLFVFLLNIQVFAQLDIKALNKEMIGTYDYSITNHECVEKNNPNKKKIVYEKSIDTTTCSACIIYDDKDDYNKILAVKLETSDVGDYGVTFDEFDRIVPAIIECNSDNIQNAILETAIMKKRSCTLFTIINEINDKMLLVDYTQQK
ncbi:hypothetical protein [Fusobacterium sp.]|uniref:hypothetical protein n=1 Tax=Fusobacterium sp. TaxID=68766 RepID=UPI000C705636|nr:hypothetical protein [Fusobacterium sp.]